MTTIHPNKVLVQVSLTEETRKFLARLVPREATIVDVHVGPYDMLITYRTAGGQHARLETVTWAAVSIEEIDE